MVANRVEDREEEGERRLTEDLPGAAFLTQSVEQRVVYSIYYMDTLVLPCIGERGRLLMRDGSGRRTRDVIHIRRMGIDIYTKYIT